MKPIADISESGLEPEPVFIGGDGRSGSTLLVDLMGLHPRLSPIYETNFVIRIQKVLGRHTFISRLRDPFVIWRIMSKARRKLPTSSIISDRGTGERFYHGPNHILIEPRFVMLQTAKLCMGVRWGNRTNAFRKFINLLFARHCEADKKPRWVNKTPRNIQVCRELHSVFPNLRLIHIVRDGRDVACSYMNRWGTDNVEELARIWLDAVREGEAFGKAHPGQYLKVKYEDLVRDPETELNRIFEWLGEPAPAGELLGEYTEQGLAISDKSVGQWRTQLTTAQKERFQEAAGEMLKQLGYV